MRILTLTNLYPNPFQPHNATFNRQQLRWLARWHDLRIIAPILWTDELKARWEGAPGLPAGRSVFCDGIPVEHPRYYYTPKVMRRWYGHFFRWSVRQAFERALVAFRPELVFAPWVYPDGWAAVELGHRAGLPVVLKVVGSDLLLLSDWPARGQGTLEALRGADGVVAVSQDLARRLAAQQVDPAKIAVVYDGIDPDVFQGGLQEEARRRLGWTADVPLLLFVGRLIPVKRIDLLLAACQRLLADELPFQCVLIGQGPLRPSLERQAERLGLSGRVRFLGAVPNDQLPQWYQAATVLALPSRSEGVPNVLLEAAACGTPFIASNVGGIPEIAHLGTCELVPPGDVARLASALKRFVTRKQSVTGPRPGLRTRADSAAELSQVLEDVLRTSRGRFPVGVSARGPCAEAGTA